MEGFTSGMQVETTATEASRGSRAQKQKRFGLRKSTRRFYDVDLSHVTMLKESGSANGWPILTRTHVTTLSCQGP